MRSRQKGFTLLEVMFALALLAFGLVVLIKSTAASIRSARDAQMMGIVADLSRSKMYDIEEKLLKDGFSDTDQSEEESDFEDEGYQNIKYSYKVEEVELPPFEQLAQMGKGGKPGTGSGSAAGSDAALGSDALGEVTDEDFENSSFGNSAFGGMLMQMGGFMDMGAGLGGTGASSVGGANAGSFIQSQYAMVQKILKDSIRKVTLTVKYDVLGKPYSLTTVAYYTDAAAMDKTLMGLGSQELPASSGSGSTTGTSGTGKSSSTKPSTSTK